MPAACLFVASTLIAGALSVAATARAGGGPPVVRRTPEEKLDPFLRGAALGVARTRGHVTDRLPAHSRAALDTLPPFVRAAPDAAEPTLFVDARVEPRAGLEGLVATGARVQGRAGDIVSLAVPVAAIDALAARPEVRWLRAARRYRLLNDVSTGDYHTEGRLQRTYYGTSGAGVIVAVVDTGIDYTNLDMRRLDGTTRVLAIWDQTITDPSHPPPPGFGFGAYYTQADIDASIASGIDLATMDGHGHGTHVAGTAAGNGNDTGNGIPAGTFAGMAPEADLLVVRVFDNGGQFCTSCDLVAAVQFIDQFAKAAGKPWVGNMSLGDDLGGAHDGTAADEIAIDSVVGPGHPGAQMAVSAGNSGRASMHFHWKQTLAAGQTFTNTFALPNNNPNVGNDNDSVWIDLWYDGADSATVEVVTPGGDTVGAAKGVDSGIVCTPSGSVRVDAHNGDDPENGESQVFITIADSSACAPVVPPALGTWTVRVITNAVGPLGGGAFDAWNLSNARGTAFVNFSTFQLASSVGVPGTARNAITAGSYVGKVIWVNGAGGISIGGGTDGDLSNFSSIGPTRDGRIKPDIAAPGQVVGSSLSKALTLVFPTNRERDNRHWPISGTSMAAPHVAGEMALLLDLNPSLDGAQLRTELQRMARVDAQTGPVPNNRFGYGKLRGFDDPDLDVTTAGAFSWPNNPAAAFWDVYRSPLPGCTSSGCGVCQFCGLPAPGFTDPAAPDVDHGFAYFVVGKLAAYGTGLPLAAGADAARAGDIRPEAWPSP